MTPRRLSPLSRFGLVSLVTMVLLAVVLGAALSERIDHRALENTERTAAILGAVVLDEPASALVNGDPTAYAVIDKHFRNNRVRASGVVQVKVFDDARTMLYSNDGEGEGTRAPATSNVAKALRGRRISHLTKGTADDGSGRQTLSVYVPIADVMGETVGVFELYLDHGPTAAAARRDVRAMWALVAGGLLVLWLGLFRLMRSVSAVLRGKVAENRHQATHDALTELPNRVLLHERLQAAIDDGGAALLLIDLDRFKEVNDTLGHDHGDALLVEVADRLRQVVRDGDVVARMGGDEFAVVCPGSTDEEQGRQLAARLAAALRAPVDLSGTAVVVDASIGLALAPAHGEDVSTLVRHADIAMYEAKHRRSEVEAYDAERDEHHRERLALLGELPRAIREGELVLAYQPKLDLVSEEVVGVEALVRWQHPEHGLLMPGAFVPSAELTRLVRPLTLCVLEQALRQHRAWDEAGLHLPIAVNLAGPSVMDVDLPAAVGLLLEETGVPAPALTLEISEGTMMTDIPSALRVLDALRDLGVLLSLDDFGTGQTSLSQLRQLPLQELKVDRSLVAGDERVVRSIVEMGHRFGLRVVGEGVETEDIAERLRSAGCDEVQGFHYARPMFAADLEPWLAGRALTPA